jgi:DNA-directed RNA polymerase subunit RPC12/RpoP
MFWFWVTIWGKKKQKKEVGEGYFNCPHCGRRQPATCLQMVIKDHVYFVGVNKGDEVGPEGYRCKVCWREFANDGKVGYDFGPHLSKSPDWKCFKCGGAVPYEQVVCPHCGFSYTG